MCVYFSENGEWRETDVKKQPFFIANSTDDGGSGKPLSAGRGKELFSSCRLMFLGDGLCCVQPDLVVSCC